RTSEWRRRTRKRGPEKAFSPPDCPAWVGGPDGWIGLHARSRFCRRFRYTFYACGFPGGTGGVTRSRNQHGIRGGALGRRQLNRAGTSAVARRRLRRDGGAGRHRVRVAIFASPV